MKKPRDLTLDYMCRVALYVAGRPDCTRWEIAKNTPLVLPDVRWSVRQMIRSGYMAERRIGARRCLFIPSVIRESVKFHMAEAKGLV